MYALDDILRTIGIVILTLKLTGLIDWSWFWVTSPFWFPIMLLVGVFILEYIDDRKNK